MTTTSTTELEQAMSTASIPEIAAVISQDWGTKVNYAARPYLDAMYGFNSVNDSYGMDSGKGAVIYFLSNAGSWRGPVARIVKAELRKRVAR